MQVSAQEQTAVLSLKSAFSTEHIAEFQELATGQMHAHIRDFVIDLTQTTFIDSRGLETLLQLQETCAEQLGQLRLACCGKEVNDILRATRLDSHFHLHDTVESAIESMKG